jgi:lipopolysaccharide export system protein LptC
MSQSATNQRAEKQRWAVPGSRHDKLVRFAKVALPSAVGVLIAVLAVAPLERDGDVSFILDKNKVDDAPERMRVDVAQYRGEDNQGRPFAIVAQSAVQPSSDVPIVNISGMLARLGLSSGPVSIVANRARYNLEQQKVAVIGPMRATGPDGYKLSTSNVTVDLKSRRVTGTGGVQGEMELGQFQGGRMTADLAARTVVLDQGARLKIVQGAVR